MRGVEWRAPILSMQLHQEAFGEFFDSVDRLGEGSTVNLL
jgi:hypothetical protein